MKGNENNKKKGKYATLDDPKFPRMIINIYGEQIIVNQIPITD